eukprot:m.50173 g.50173  ORF g.50173 m.50173 type:complete len:698 (-) comp7211_c0_seq2:133-2226(-)
MIYPTVISAVIYSTTTHQSATTMHCSLLVLSATVVVAASGHRLPASTDPYARLDVDGTRLAYPRPEHTSDVNSIPLAGHPPTPPAPQTYVSFNFSAGDDMVLQQAPAKACVNGVMGVGGTAVTVKLTSALQRTTATDSVVDNGITVSLVSARVTSSPIGDGTSLWHACLDPQQAGGSYTLTAVCTGCTNSTPAVLQRVTFGDVWYCGGQSNMALPLAHTMSRNISRDAILAGKYANIRIHGLQGNMNPMQPWSTLKGALATNNDSDMSNFGGFSSTCYYFAESLTDEMINASGSAVPIGVIHTAWGGSTIEQWLSNDSITGCAQASISSANSEWHETRVLPYVGTTVKGWVWYQGENDMHNYFGNSMMDSGYACLMKTLVAQWRTLWSATPGTTDPNAPFGLVTLAPSGGEGGQSMGAMRWAQTASHGVAPNPDLPNVFVAQAFDLNDPFSNDTCYGVTKCHDNSVPPPGGWPPSCQAYCASVRTTNWYMGPIHPRTKKPVGARLAQTSMAVAYGKKTWSTGPTISGCSVSGGKITITFNQTLLDAGGADKVTVQPYYQGNVTVKNKVYNTAGSKMDVLVNATDFCVQEGGKGCRDDGTGHNYSYPVNESAWIAVDITEGSAPNEVVVDLSRAGGAAFAIRYGWKGDCCSENPPSADPCPLASCPLVASGSKLPANPFLAHIVGGKCKCIAPQTCDE